MPQLARYVLDPATLAPDSDGFAPSRKGNKVYEYPVFWLWWGSTKYIRKSNLFLAAEPLTGISHVPSENIFETIIDHRMKTPGMNLIHAHYAFANQQSQTADAQCHYNSHINFFINKTSLKLLVWSLELNPQHWVVLHQGMPLVTARAVQICNTILIENSVLLSSRCGFLDSFHFSKILNPNLWPKSPIWAVIGHE